MHIDEGMGLVLGRHLPEISNFSIYDFSEI
jgi:hypothetical protein